jgi:hypothetical protein
MTVRSREGVGRISENPFENLAVEKKRIALRHRNPETREALHLR